MTLRLRGRSVGAQSGGGSAAVGASMGRMPVVPEVACDESGFSGTNLLGSSSAVVTHASIDLTLAEAAELLANVHPGHPGRPEYKSSRLLRPDQRPELERFLAALRGR